MRLLLVTLMICMATPILYESLANFQKVSGTTLMQDQVDKVQQAARDVCRQGIGCQRTVRLELPTEDCCLLIGGRSRSESMSVGFSMTGEMPVRTYLTDPNIRFITPENRTVMLQGPMLVIIIRCVNDVEGYAVEVLT